MKISTVATKLNTLRHIRVSEPPSLFQVTECIFVVIQTLEEGILLVSF